MRLYFLLIKTAGGLFSRGVFTAEQDRPFLVKELSYEKSIDENKCKNTCTWIAFMATLFGCKQPSGSSKTLQVWEEEMVQMNRLFNHIVFTVQKIVQIKAFTHYIYCNTFRQFCIYFACF